MGGISDKLVALLSLHLLLSRLSTALLVSLKQILLRHGGRPIALALIVKKPFQPVGSTG
jgi:hypothetical protein